MQWVASYFNGLSTVKLISKTWKRHGDNMNISKNQIFSYTRKIGQSRTSRRDKKNHEMLEGWFSTRLLFCLSDVDVIHFRIENASSERMLCSHGLCLYLMYRRSLCYSLTFHIYLWICVKCPRLIWGHCVAECRRSCWSVCPWPVSELWWCSSWC